MYVGGFRLGRPVIRRDIDMISLRYDVTSHIIHARRTFSDHVVELSAATQSGEGTMHKLPLTASLAQKLVRAQRPQIVSAVVGEINIAILQAS